MTIQNNLKCFFALIISTFFFLQNNAAQTKNDSYPLKEYNVTWNEPGDNYKGSMPIGNGDIGINLWTENSGDIVFLIGKTDAWSENGQLVKLGRVRIKLSSNPFNKGNFLSQELIPDKGEIVITSKAGTILKAWIDANNPVIHIEINSNEPVTMQAQTELWRNHYRVTKQKGLELGGIGVFRELSGIPSGEVTIDPDTVLPAINNQLCWLHHNNRSTYPIVFQNQHLESLLPRYPDPLLNNSFGVLMKGHGLISKNNRELQSVQPKQKLQLDLYALTDQSSVTDWHKKISRISSQIETLDIEKARQAHYAWWSQFWDRSWIKVSGDNDAEKVTQGYAMQRWMCAASGRGKMPLKYNGSIFTVGQEPALTSPYDPALGQIDPDHRAWGGNYWFQNQRLLYWPMITSGDTDLLKPFINLFYNALPLAKDRIHLMFGHEGAIFPETIYFWGLPNNNDFGWGNKEMTIRNGWIRNHTNGSLELIAMMISLYENTHDNVFLNQKLLPIADAVTTYYDQHWKIIRGKMNMNPSQALETRQQATNPTPDIAGLMCVLPKLINMPANAVSPDQKKMWLRMLKQLPPIPLGYTDSAGQVPQLLEQMSKNGKQIILPAEKFSRTANAENPELYTIFPYKIYGVDRPELQLAKNTYEAKRFKSSTCWGQDGVEAAMLGWSNKAKAEVIANFTRYGGEKFKWSWARGHDWEPDMDNGGAGQLALQAMLLQTNGNKLLLFPAWPKEWNVDFKLHAPDNTIIEGSLQNGQLKYLKTIPESRMHDIVNMMSIKNE